MSPIALYTIGALLAFVAGAWFGAALMRRKVVERSQSEASARQDQVLEALDHVLEGELRGAYDVLAGLARERNAAVEVYFALAALLRSQGRVERAAQVYRTILARPNLHRDETDKARVGLARTLVALGRGEEAKALMEELPKKRRTEVSLLALQGQAAVQRGDWDGAFSAHHALAKAEGSNGQAKADVYSDVAEQAAARGDLEAAFRGFRKALKEEPDSVRAQYGLAQLYIREGKTGKARRQLIAAVQSNPSLFPILLPELQHLKRNDGGSEEARLRDLLSELGEHEGIGLWVGLERADRLFAEDRLEESQVLLEALVDGYPRSVEAHEAYLNLLLEIEDHDGLKEELERFVDLAAEEIRRFRCRRCGFLSAKPFLECPNCRAVGAVHYESG